MRYVFHHIKEEIGKGIIHQTGKAGFNLSMANGNMSFAEHLWETSIRAHACECPAKYSNDRLWITCLGGDVFTMNDVSLCFSREKTPPWYSVFSFIFNAFKFCYSCFRASWTGGWHRKVHTRVWMTNSGMWKNPGQVPNHPENNMKNISWGPPHKG